MATALLQMSVTVETVATLGPNAKSQCAIEYQLMILLFVPVMEHASLLISVNVNLALQD